MSYEVDYKWQAFYDERSPKKREKILKDMIGDREPSGEEALPGMFFYRRFAGLHTDQPVDHFFAAMFDMMDLGRRSPLFAATARRRIAKNMTAFGFEEAEQYGETGRAFLYMELRNAVTRYLWTCTSDDYGKVFDMIKISLQQKKNRMSEELADMSVNVQHRYLARMEGELADRMQVFVDAAQDAWSEFDRKYVKTSADEEE